MKARFANLVVVSLGVLCVSVASVCRAGDEGEPSAPPVALACGSAFMPMLNAVNDLRREEAVLARGTDALALRVVQARLAVAEAVQRFTLSRYAGSDLTEALAAMRQAVAKAEALPRAQGAALVVSTRSTLNDMLASAQSTYPIGMDVARP